MLVFNIFCSVCKAQFKNDDAVHSTSCGHIFHFTCMNQWQCRSTSCPLCRTYKPETYRIYLNFEDLCENDIQAKLIANNKRIAEMEEAIKKKDKKIDEIQRLYNVSEQWRAELQDKIEKLMSNAESELHIKDGKGLENVSAENFKLRKKLIACETVSIGLNQKIEVLELKLKLVTEELKKRVEENVDQSVSNIERKCSASILEESIKPTIKNDHGLKTPKKVFNFNKSAHMYNGSKTINNDDQNQYKVVIQDFPKAKLNSTSLKAAVILLGSEISVFLSENDIANVNVAKKGVQNKSNKINLIVTFTTIERKEEFLSNRVLLKMNSSTESIRIKEFTNNDVYTLFKYANTNLRPNGYHFIYVKGSTVIAKRNFADKNEIFIKNRSDVDELLRKIAAIKLAG
ncbi:hypothetical protein DOY81_008617 [Sarcophaga bullata]|nr:hypothetical protein DOY81_008617 [Sarcophaga bullata]